MAIYYKKTKLKPCVDQTKHLTWARCSPPISQWQLLGCSSSYRNVSFTRAESLSYLVCFPSAIPGAQSKHSINIEVKSGAVRRHFNTLCALCRTQFPLWFYAPDNRLLVNNTMHMGPGEYLLSGCQKNEENHSSHVGLALSLLSLCIQEAGDHSMLSY